LATQQDSSGFRPRVRDTLYLDADRVRVALGQLRGGVVEAVVQRSVDSTERRLSARVLGLEAGKNLLGEASIEQTMTLQDVLLDIFEEAANESGLFISADLTDPDAWRAGEPHRTLRAEQLLRVTAPTQILDPEHVAGEMLRAIELVEGIAFFQEAQDPTPLPPAPPPQARRGKKYDPDELRQAAVSARAEAALGFPIPAAVAIGHVFAKVLGSGISVRVFPCGAEHGDLTLAGRLVQRDGYLRDEHDTLFAKYGWGASEWTVIAQLATVPRPPNAEPVDPADDGSNGAAEAEVDDSGTGKAHAPEAGSQPDEPEPSTAPSTEAPGDSIDQDEAPDRAEFEALGIEFMKTLADAGLISAPGFPGLTMTPMAIYRDVPVHPADGTDR
jgi:hypothetical protein